LVLPQVVCRRRLSVGGLAVFMAVPTVGAAATYSRHGHRLQQQGVVSDFHPIHQDDMLHCMHMYP
jgi:hypothetical protein